MSAATFRTADGELARHPFAWGLFALALIGFPAWRYAVEPPLPADAFTLVPAFALTDQAGAAYGHDDLIGQVTIVDFIFTRCKDVCPTLSSHMAALAGDLGAADAASPIRFLSISVDPDYDTPAVLSAYAQRYGARPEQWRFVTGDRVLVDGLIEGLQQGLERDPGTGEVPNIMHSQRFLLIDPMGGVRGLYSIDAEGLAALRHDARALAGATMW